MKEKNPAKIDSLSDKGEKEKIEEFINVFNYFENANIRNREAFIELLNYTIKNKRIAGNTEDTEIH